MTSKTEFSVLQITKGTELWLHDVTDKNVGLNLPLLFKCTQFDQLILRKIVKIVATRCQILRLKCNKFDFGWGSAPDPAGRAYSVPQTPYLDKGGLLLNGEGKEREEKRGVERNGEGGEGKERGHFYLD